MTDRVLIGMFGGKAVFRVSKEGKSCFSDDVNDFNIHEDHFIYRGLVRDEVSFTGVGWQEVQISGIEGPSLVVLQSTTDDIPSAGNTYFAYFINNERLRIRNRQNVARTIRYCVFGNTLSD